MMFFTQLFTSKRGSLAKIWLAAHWEKKLTKAHVFDCNLETTIRDILSDKMKIGLRTSGHLLLGVVKIYSRKTKYLLADCSDALVKIKMAFRPGQTDLPAEGLEATLKAITLVEDFTAFDTPLPLPSDFDVVDHLSLNQCRSEQITLKEDFGHQFLNFQDIGGDGSQSQANTLLDRSFDSFGPHGDGFGDEENGFDLLDFLSNASDPTEPTNFVLEEPPHENNKSSTINDDQHQMDFDSRDPEAPTINETTLLTSDEAAFALEPVPITPNSESKMGKRKRKLVVDQTKELSNESIKEQISDYSDLVAPLDMAPPTVQLMQWKESGGVDKLFSTPCSTVVNTQIKELFAKSVFQVKYYCIRGEVEQIRQEEHEAQRDLSTLTTDISVADSSLGTEQTHNTEPKALDLMKDNWETYSEAPQDENSVEFSHPDLPSEDSMFVHPSNVEQCTQSTSLYTQSLLGSQDFEERRITRRALKLLNELKRSQTVRDPAFSLEVLCEGSTRSQAANTFFSLLVLKKQQIVLLHQTAPYHDISVTPGPKYYT
ncbi:double-strand-break repair protein rad21-like protein 1 isoform X1 [Girardinichthys multiradiatus]|uniref:double-strand-break repair protein rad21-like protein 1 isoform X1 n=1 Tax=Girardinichthys multiradiatus TaxID=208333 RepID=UPI001FADE223|nr:double-strand-break repair protein rad21-like protein 1 isoform X1 [Girardinichthys multiradiatus]